MECYLKVFLPRSIIPSARGALWKDFVTFLLSLLTALTHGKSLLQWLGMVNAVHDCREEYTLPIDHV